MLRRILSYLFKYLVMFRAFLYAKGLLKSLKISARVISIGNISVGGSGKTPLSIWLTLKLNQKGLKTALLEKGYKSGLRGDEVFISDGTKKVEATFIGDEPAMALRSLQGKALLCVSKDKTRGAVELTRDHPDIKYIVVDDGFQHLRLHRDVNVVLMDSQEGFNGKLMPLGKLRESYTALKRATAVIFTKTDGLSEEDKKELKLKAEAINKNIFIFFADVKFFSSQNIDKLKILPVSSVSNYQFFHKKLRDSGAIFEKYIAHRDHHNFAKDDIDYIVKLFKSTGADFVVYTSKDAVKVKELLKQKGVPAVEVWYDHEIDRPEEFVKLCIG